MIVAALGVLYAGGAYLPMDQSWPEARRRFILDGAQPIVLIGDDTVRSIGVAGGRTLIALDRTGQVIGHELSTDINNDTVDVKPEDLAYVIYTSGSTGQPKGVEITHAGLQNLISWHLEAFGVTSADRATQIASPGFDAAVWEVWPYLAAGASVHIPDDDTVKDPDRLRDWLVANEITIGFAPTPLAERLISLTWPSTTALRILLTGADTLRHYPPVTLPFSLVNNYGPTECTVVTTSGTVRPDESHGRLPSIGRPIRGAVIHILDEQMRPVPPGNIGELYIGGAGLARGYRNRPDLTAEAFVVDPVSHKRLYKSGDMASVLPNGEIAFVGRIDDQVKISGYRIELNEIAAALNGHPEIAFGVVIADQYAPGEKRLIAYIVPKRGAKLHDFGLRRFLLETLPDYMVPVAFCLIDAVPITASGKLDRNALPSLNEASVLVQDEYVAPRTPLEERVAAILRHLLGADRIGIKDNFFLLGGNSLMGAQVIARVRDDFGVELSLLSLFDHPTILELSSEIECLIVDKVDNMGGEEADRLGVD